MEKTTNNITTDNNSLTKEKFSLTDNAAKRLKFLISQEDNKEAYFRISVLGGGCSGFQYNFGFDPNKNSDDILIEKDGVKALIDETSINFIEGSVLDYVETLGSAAFEIKNPNATANCGCGNSFSV